MSVKPVPKLMTILLLCLLMARMKRSEASCNEQYNICKRPIPRDDLTCGETDADTFCQKRVCTNPDTSTKEDCCKATETGKGICCCGPFYIGSPGQDEDGDEEGDVDVVPDHGDGASNDNYVVDVDVVPDPGDGAPNDNYVVVGPTREDCSETAWLDPGTTCNDLNCRGTCGSHGFGSNYDTCIKKDPDPYYCCCIPMCARFLVSAITNICNEAACVAACLLQGFLAQHVNKCLDDRCCCGQLWIPRE